MLENPTQAVSDASYFDCIDAVMENSKVRTSLTRTLVEEVKEEEEVEEVDGSTLSALLLVHRSSVSPWLGFPTTPRTPTCRSLATPSAVGPKLCAASRKLLPR